MILICDCLGSVTPDQFCHITPHRFIVHPCKPEEFTEKDGTILIHCRMLYTDDVCTGRLDAQHCQVVIGIVDRILYIQP